MQKDTLLSAFRALLTLIGSFVVGKIIGNGSPITTGTWDVIMGSALTLFSIIWGIADKSATIEGVQSAIRSVVISIGGLLVAAGYVTGKTLEGILGFVTAILPVIQSYTSKLKVQAINNGTLRTSSTGKALRILIFFIFSSALVHGQSIFKRVPAPKFSINKQRSMMTFNPNELAVMKDSIWTGFRPIVGVAAFSEPGDQLMTGAGVGYQRLVWDYSTNKWNCQYSLSVIGWAAGSVSPGPQIPAFGIGPAIGLFNNLLLFGGGYDFTHGQFFGALSFGVSLNN